MKHLKTYEDIHNPFNDKYGWYGKVMQLFFEDQEDYEVFPFPYEDDVKGITITGNFEVSNIDKNFFQSMTYFLEFVEKYKGSYEFSTYSHSSSNYLVLEVTFYFRELKEIEKILIDKFGMEGHPETINYNL
jgi:hypothetical protein